MVCMTLWVVTAAAGLAGCSDACEELQTICDRCQDPYHRSSCEASVDEDVQDSCEQNIDNFNNICK